MKSKILVAFLSLAVSALNCPITKAESRQAPFFYFELTKSERQEFENRACKSLRQPVEYVHATSWGEEDHSNMYAYGRCQPHRKIGGLPVAMEAGCKLDEGVWQCELFEVLFDKAGGDNIRISVKQNTSLEQAQHFVRYLVTMRAMYGATPIDDWTAIEHCRSSQPCLDCRVTWPQNGVIESDCSGHGEIWGKQRADGEYDLSDPVNGFPDSK